MDSTLASTTTKNPTIGFETLATTDLLGPDLVTDFHDTGVLHRMIHDGVFPLSIEADSDVQSVFATLA